MAAQLIRLVVASLVAAANALDDPAGPLSVEVAPQLLPGSIVGQGRYVLAEKMCDLCQLPPNPWLLQQGTSSEQLRLTGPGPVGQFMLTGPEDSMGQPITQLVPYDGLRSVIESSLPQLPFLPEPAPIFLPEVYDYSVSFVRSDPNFTDHYDGYRFGHRLGKGAFGEAWRAVALDGSMQEVVLKRLFVEQGAHIRRSGLREIHFGLLLQHRPHIARFMESFEHRGPTGIGGQEQTELWLVFHNEGFSMTHHLWQVQPGSTMVQLKPAWWLLKRQQPLGGMVIKNLAYQLVNSIAVAHDLNITHRDIKMSNVFMTETWPPEVRLGDWGSALVSPPPDDVRGMYGPDGPDTQEETSGYEPPEVTFDEELLRRVGLAKASPWRDRAYDLWSLGVVLLELILGTREVFQLDDRRWLRAEHRLRQGGVYHERMNQGRRLQALLDLCLVPIGAPSEAPLEWFFQPAEKDDAPDTTVRLNQAAPFGGAGSTSGCSDERFAEVLKSRDAAGIGLPDRDGRDLILRLLAWSPQDRIPAREALSHRWFDDGAQLPMMRPIRPSEKRAFAPQWDDSECQGELDGEDELDCEGCVSDEVDDEEGSPELRGIGDEEFGQGTIGEEGQEDERAVLPEASVRIPEAPHGCAREVSWSDESTGGGAWERGAVASGCQGLQLHAGVFSDIGRRRSQEDRQSVYNLSSRCGGGTSSMGIDAGRPHEAGFIGVFDGHRGQRVAERLRRSLHKHLVADHSFPANISAALEGAFFTFDQLLMREGGSSSSSTSSISSSISHSVSTQVDTAGSTALVGVAAGCRLHLANLGDCRAVVALRDHHFAGDGGAGDRGPWPVGARVEVRESPSAELRGQRGTIVEVRSVARRVYVVRLLRDGTLRPLRQTALRLLSELRAERLTEDHKPDSAGERQRIEALGGVIEPPSGGNGPWRVAGLATSRSFGSPGSRPLLSAEPELREYPLDPERDVFVVLASDGVWDVLDDQLVVDLVWDQISSGRDARRGPGAALEGAAQHIVQAALEAGSLDNLTCVVLLLTWTGEATAASSTEFAASAERE